MKNWFFWAGISFVIGGAISWALTAGVSEPVSAKEDLSGYALGWIAVGIVLTVIGYVKRKT